MDSLLFLSIMEVFLGPSRLSQAIIPASTLSPGRLLLSQPSCRLTLLKTKKRSSLRNSWPEGRITLLKSGFRINTNRILSPPFKNLNLKALSGQLTGQTISAWRLKLLLVALRKEYFLFGRKIPKRRLLAKARLFKAKIAFPSGRWTGAPSATCSQFRKETIK